MDASADPYVLSPGAIEAPPPSLQAALRRIGPGIVLAASIVGSGEVIATTTLGAQVGFAALWIVLASCAIKPVVQAELGRFTIATGSTGLEGFDRVPGPRAGVNWLIWAWAITVTLTLMQVGGMYGGVAQVLHILTPAVSVNTWVAICLALTLAVLLGGGYERIERFAIVKVGLFTLLTVCAAAVLMRRSGAVAAGDLASGLSFELPAAGLMTAIAVFGITGVGATELVMYPYWCIEKGYARFVGPDDSSAAWLARARGWIRVMHVDIVCSLVIYTLATTAFYLLGAGVLHRMGARAREPRYRRSAVADLHADAGRVGALGLLRGCGRDVVRDDFRVHRRALASLRGRRPHRRRLRARRCAKPGAVAQPLRRRARDDPGNSVLAVRVAGADGRRGRRRAGADASAHRNRRDLPAPHARCPRRSGHRL